jgi:hypothetical protein
MPNFNQHLVIRQIVEVELQDEGVDDKDLEQLP